SRERPGTRSRAYERCAAQVTTWVSPHEGHMTSIGRRLVDRSIGLPQRRQVIDVGEVGAERTGPSGGGGGTAALPPIGPKPPPDRLHIAITAIRSRTNSALRTIAKTGAPPTSVDQNELPVGPTWTVWNALAPVFSSFANTSRPPFPVPAGIVRKRAAAGPVVMAVAEAEADDKDQRNWLGRDAVPFAVRVRCAWTVSPAAYEVLSKLKPRTKPAAWEIVACAWVVFPRSVAVTWNVSLRLDGFGVRNEEKVALVVPDKAMCAVVSSTSYAYEGFVMACEEQP